MWAPSHSLSVSRSRVSANKLSPNFNGHSHHYWLPSHIRYAFPHATHIVSEPCPISLDSIRIASIPRAIFDAAHSWRLPRSFFSNNQKGKVGPCNPLIFSCSCHSSSALPSKPRTRSKPCWRRCFFILRKIHKKNLSKSFPFSLFLQHTRTYLGWSRMPCAALQKHQ